MAIIRISNLTDTIIAAAPLFTPAGVELYLQDAQGTVAMIRLTDDQVAMLYGQLRRHVEGARRETTLPVMEQYPMEAMPALVGAAP